MAARYRLITITATIFLLNGAIARAQTDWPTFGFDSQRTGYNPYETVLSVATVPNLQLQWMQTFACPFTAQPIEANSVLYVADWCGSSMRFSRARETFFGRASSAPRPPAAGISCPLPALESSAHRPSTPRTIASLLLQATIKSTRLIRRPASTSRGIP